MIVVISSPEFFAEEHEIINELFKNGLQIFHLRKPGQQKEKILELLNKINPENFSGIVLHQNYEVREAYNINKVHFNELTRRAEAGKELLPGIMYTTSIHNKEEINKNLNGFEYCFLGPVFDSISKTGYLKMNDADISNINRNTNCRILAIGGIDKDNIKKVQELGYDGAALLGSVWLKPDKANENYINIKKAWNSGL